MEFIFNPFPNIFAPSLSISLTVHIQIYQSMSFHYLSCIICHCLYPVLSMLNSSLILHLNQLLLLNGFYSLIIIISSVYSDLPFIHLFILLRSNFREVNAVFTFNPSPNILVPSIPTPISIESSLLTHYSQTGHFVHTFHVHTSPWHN